MGKSYLCSKFQLGPVALYGYLGNKNQFWTFYLFRVRCQRSTKSVKYSNKSCSYWPNIQSPTIPSSTFRENFKLLGTFENFQVTKTRFFHFSPTFLQKFCICYLVMDRYKHQTSNGSKTNSIGPSPKAVGPKNRYSSRFGATTSYDIFFDIYWLPRVQKYQNYPFNIVLLRFRINFLAQRGS